MKNLLTKTLFISLLFSAVNGLMAVKPNHVSTIVAEKGNNVVGNLLKVLKHPKTKRYGACAAVAYGIYRSGGFGRAKKAAQNAWTNNEYYVRDGAKVGAGIAIGLIPFCYLSYKAAEVSYEVSYKVAEALRIFFPDFFSLLGW